QMGRPSAGLARSIVPNAGLPQRVEGQFIYAAGPNYFAGEVPRFLDAGAQIVGGCCGTTPEHIRAMRQAVDIYGARQRSLSPAAEIKPEIGGTPRTPVAERPSGTGTEPPPPTR